MRTTFIATALPLLFAFAAGQPGPAAAGSAMCLEEPSREACIGCCDGVFVLDREDCETQQNDCRAPCRTQRTQCVGSAFTTCLKKCDFLTDCEDLEACVRACHEKQEARIARCDARVAPCRRRCKAPFRSCLGVARGERRACKGGCESLPPAPLIAAAGSGDGETESGEKCQERCETSVRLCKQHVLGPCHTHCEVECSEFPEAVDKCRKHCKTDNKDALKSCEVECCDLCECATTTTTSTTSTTGPTTTSIAGASTSTSTSTTISFTGTITSTSTSTTTSST